MSYNPNPPDHPDSEIPPDLLELVEQMAESTHNVWSRQRLAEGWKYGPQRDDVKKEHPGLGPKKGGSPKSRIFSFNLVQKKGHLQG